MFPGRLHVQWDSIIYISVERIFPCVLFNVAPQLLGGDYNKALQNAYNTPSPINIFIYSMSVMLALPYLCQNFMQHYLSTERSIVLTSNNKTYIENTIKNIFQLHCLIDALKLTAKTRGQSPPPPPPYPTTPTDHPILLHRPLQIGFLICDSTGFSLLKLHAGFIVQSAYQSTTC